MGPRTTAFRVERSGSYRWLALGCGALILISVCGIVGVVLLIESNVSEPANAARGFFLDVRARNSAQALQRMSPTYQSTHDLSRFQIDVAAIPALATHQEETILTNDIDGRTATIEATLATPNGPTPVTVTLTPLGDHWYVESFTAGVGGTHPAQPAR